MQERSARVKTLVVTDLVDSTRLFAELGDLKAGRLSVRHERMARDLLAECGGREIDKTDGFLILFDRAVDAVRFALGYHGRLAELSGAEGVELTARVGIHLGEVYERHNPPEDVARGAKPVEVEGFAKPVAARVMALAEARQTLLTRAAFDLARQGAASEPIRVDGMKGRLRWLAHGPYRLKGVDEPVEIFEVGVTGFAPLLVPKSTAKARRAVSGEDELTLGWRPAPGLEVPRRAHWILVERLGEGGFGEVWLGTHEKTGEKRVFKFCYRADHLRSLQREVTLFRLLKESLGTRDDIARIIEWNFDKAPYFLESEYTEGGNLLEWVAERGGIDRIPLATRLELIAQVADALAAAHSVGVLHKDVKPSNVLIREGARGAPSVRLTDFGIGLVTDRSALTDRGITVFDLTEMVAESTSTPGGTHLYMAPEVVEGRTPTVQADVYALGVMLYQFLVGDFSRSLAPGWRRDLDDDLLLEDISAMVDGHPERRLRNAQEVADRLRSLEERRAQRDAERRERAERKAERRALERAQRRRKLSAVIAAVATIVLAVVSTLAYQAIEAREEAEHRRAQAENLIGFMVGDLRKKLEPIGRLDVLDEVGDQALDYFDTVPADDLTDDEIYRRSQALYQIGEVRASQGDLAAALEAYRESL
ncbi:MAG: protein kinase, partial [Acidobacteriota bacterium]